MNNTPEKSLLEKLGFTTGDTIFVETTPDWYTMFADDNEVVGIDTNWSGLKFVRRQKKDTN